MFMMARDAVSAADELESIRDQLVTALGRLNRLIAEGARDEPSPEHGALRLPRTEAIESVLDAARRPMGPVEVWEHLTDLGRVDPKMEVQVTTYDLWRRGRLVKLRRGIYCHPGHVPPGEQPMQWEG